MKINRIELEGFQSWRDRQEIDLTHTDLVGIVGPVRAGKTSIINAIEFAIWGNSRGEVVTDVINDDSSAARVMVEFEAGGQHYRVTRTRPRRGTQEVLFTIADPSAPSGWKDITPVKSGAADPEIIATIGMGESLSSLTWLVRQNDYAAFCKKTGPERRNILAEAFGLNQFTVLAKQFEEARKEQAEKVTRTTWDRDRSITLAREAMVELNSYSTVDEAQWADEVNQWAGGDTDGLAMTQAISEIAREVTSLEGDLDDIAEQIASNGNRTEALAQAQALRNEHATALAHWRRIRSDLDQRLETTQTDLAAARQRKKKVDEAVASLDALAGELAAVKDRRHSMVAAVEAKRTQIAAHTSRMNSINDEESLLSEQIEDLTERIEALDDSSGQCVVCESDLSAEQVASLRERTSDQIENLEERVTNLHEEYSENSGAAIALQREIPKIEKEMESVKAAEEKSMSKLAAARFLADSGDEAAARLTQLEAQVETLTSQIADHGDEPQLDVERIESLEKESSSARLTALEARRDELKAALTQRREDLSTAKRAAKVIEKTVAEIESIDTRLAAESQRLADITLIRDGFRPAGAPSMILAGVVDELNAEANIVMSETGDDGLTVQVSTKKVTAKGEATERVTVYAVTAAGKLRSFTALSGSEQFRVSLAIRLGLAKCIARRTGTPVQMIVLDEGWGNLDEPSRRDVAAVLKRIAASGFRVITISHVEDVKDSFTHVVQVSSATGTSTAQVVSL